MFNSHFDLVDVVHSRAHALQHRNAAKLDRYGALPLLNPGATSGASSDRPSTSASTSRLASAASSRAAGDGVAGRSTRRGAVHVNIAPDRVVMSAARAAIRSADTLVGATVAPHTHSMPQDWWLPERLRAQLQLTPADPISLVQSRIKDELHAVAASSVGQFAESVSWRGFSESSPVTWDVRTSKIRAARPAELAAGTAGLDVRTPSQPAPGVAAQAHSAHERAAPEPVAPLVQWPLAEPPMQLPLPAELCVARACLRVNTCAAYVPDALRPSRAALGRMLLQHECVQWLVVACVWLAHLGLWHSKRVEQDLLAVYQGRSDLDDLPYGSAWRRLLRRASACYWELLHRIPRHRADSFFRLLPCVVTDAVVSVYYYGMPGSRGHYDAVLRLRIGLLLYAVVSGSVASPSTVLQELQACFPDTVPRMAGSRERLDAIRRALHPLSMTERVNSLMLNSLPRETFFGYGLVAEAASAAPLGAQLRDDAPPDSADGDELAEQSQHSSGSASRPAVRRADAAHSPLPVDSVSTMPSAAIEGGDSHQLDLASPSEIALRVKVQQKADARAHLRMQRVALQREQSLTLATKSVHLAMRQARLGSWRKPFDTGAASAHVARLHPWMKLLAAGQWWRAHVPERSVETADQLEQPKSPQVPWSPAGSPLRRSALIHPMATPADARSPGPSPVSAGMRGSASSPTLESPSASTRSLGGTPFKFRAPLGVSTSGSVVKQPQPAAATQDLCVPLKDHCPVIKRFAPVPWAMAGGLDTFKPLHARMAEEQAEKSQAGDTTNDEKQPVHQLSAAASLAAANDARRAVAEQVRAISNSTSIQMAAIARDRHAARRVLLRDRAVDNVSDAALAVQMQAWRDAEAAASTRSYSAGSASGTPAALPMKAPSSLLSGPSPARLRLARVATANARAARAIRMPAALQDPASLSQPIIVTAEQSAAQAAHAAATAKRPSSAALLLSARGLAKHAEAEHMMHSSPSAPVLISQRAAIQNPGQVMPVPSPVLAVTATAMRARGPGMQRGAAGEGSTTQATGRGWSWQNGSLVERDPDLQNNLLADTAVTEEKLRQILATYDEEIELEALKAAEERRAAASARAEAAAAAAAGKSGRGPSRAAGPDRDGPGATQVAAVAQSMLRAGVARSADTADLGAQAELLANAARLPQRVRHGATLPDTDMRRILGK